jgi:thiamine pyrophosphate-dependent acetolactate synthase large subunit-like protein
MLSRSDAIRKIIDRHGENAAYITNTGYISRAVYTEYPDLKNIFYMQGSMGLAPAIGLGCAINTQKDVIVLSGDASLLMHLGITHTIRDSSLSNLYVYILDNGCHESVGQYSCSTLESSYPGVTEIMKISCDGKRDRVGVGFPKNFTDVKNFLVSKDC